MKIAVVGAGIAGVAVAELLQRYPENRVTLIEAQSQIGAGASMDQHGWFHTGSLYSIQSLGDSIASAIKNVKTLTRYYGSYLNPPSTDAVCEGYGSWFVDEPISYLFPDRSRLRYEADHAGSNRELRSFIDFSDDILSAVTSLQELIGMNKVRHGLKVVSSDLPMRTKTMLSDLVSSFTSNGGEIRLFSHYVSHSPTAVGAVSVGFADGSAIDADLCVICSGEQLASSGVDGRRLVARRSPIMVVAPALCRENIVVVEDEDRASFSHIVHSCHGQRYSVVSGSYSADKGDIDSIQHASAMLRAVTRSHFPSTFDRSSHRTYFGTKVDRIQCERSRNYSPTIMELGPNVIGAIPGKFSFAFLLAHDLALRIMGGKTIPLARPSSSRLDAALVATPKHEIIAADLFQELQHQ